MLLDTAANTSLRQTAPAIVLVAFTASDNLLSHGSPAISKVNFSSLQPLKHKLCDVRNMAPILVQKPTLNLVHLSGQDNHHLLGTAIRHPATP